MTNLLWILCLGWISLAADSAWWEKPDNRKKVRDERQVIVVIKSEKEAGQSYYSMTGAGAIRAPREHVIQKILAFGELEKVSSYFKKVVHQPQLDRVYFLLEAYGYEARLLIKYNVTRTAEKTNFHWNVVWGGFEGMVGDVELTSLKSDKTEAILKARFDDKQVPLPNIFKSFVLEIIVQQVAKSMREYIENAYVQPKGTL